MCMKNNSEFIDMMKGSYARFTQYELWNVISNLNNLHINTIYIQQLSDGTFICAVDKPTIECFLKEEGQI